MSWHSEICRSQLLKSILDLIAGIPVKDDMLIILGRNKVGVNPAKNEDLEVKDAITELLQSDLGINVSLDRPTIALDKPLDSDPKSEEILGRLHMKFRSSPRRPAILQRLKVTKKSLQCWLQRRTGASTRWLCCMYKCQICVKFFSQFSTSSIQFYCNFFRWI